MPTHAEKLEAHASILLDEFIRLREKYAILDPMLFHKEVPKLRGSQKQARGFLVLRQSLLLSCCQDIAKLSVDISDRAPSIKNILTGLSITQTRLELRERFALRVAPPAQDLTDPEILEALRLLDLQEEEENRARYDATYSEALLRLVALEDDVSVKAFKSIRDKVSAHTDVHYVVDKYALVDISTLGLNWKDVRKTIAAMQLLVADVGLLVRGAGFAWDMLDKQLSEAALNFWLPDADA